MKHMSADITSTARRVLEELFPANDTAAVTALTSERFVNHEAPPGTPPGPGSVTMFMRMLNDAFAEQKWTIHQTVTEGDRVVVHCTHSGRHVGDWFGLPATGRTFAYQQMHMLRFDDGAPVEHWAVRDDAALMRQLTAPTS